MSDHSVVAREIQEASLVDLAYQLLEEKGEPMQFKDILNTVAKQKQFTEEEIEFYISQLYTDLNIDGRFVCVGRSTWAVREWYTLDETTEAAVADHIKEDDELDSELEDESFDEDEEFDNDLDGLDEDLDETSETSGIDEDFDLDIDDEDSDDENY